MCLKNDKYYSPRTAFDSAVLSAAALISRMKSNELHQLGFKRDIYRNFSRTYSEWKNKDLEIVIKSRDFRSNGLKMTNVDLGCYSNLPILLHCREVESIEVLGICIYNYRTKTLSNHHFTEIFDRSIEGKFFVSFCIECFEALATACKELENERLIYEKERKSRLDKEGHQTKERRSVIIAKKINCIKKNKLIEKNFKKVNYIGSER